MGALGTAALFQIGFERVCAGAPTSPASARQRKAPCAAGVPAVQAYVLRRAAGRGDSAGCRAAVQGDARRARPAPPLRCRPLANCSGRPGRPAHAHTHAHPRTPTRPVLGAAGLAYKIQTSPNAQKTQYLKEIRDTVLGFGWVVGAMVAWPLANHRLGYTTAVRDNLEDCFPFAIPSSIAEPGTPTYTNLLYGMYFIKMFIGFMIADAVNYWPVPRRTIPVGGGQATILRASPHVPSHPSPTWGARTCGEARTIRNATSNQTRASGGFEPCQEAPVVPPQGAVGVSQGPPQPPQPLRPRRVRPAANAPRPKPAQERPTLAGGVPCARVGVWGRREARTADPCVHLCRGPAVDKR